MALVGMASASAASFTDFYDLTFEGQPVQNGAFLEAGHWDKEAGYFSVDIDVTPKQKYTKAEFTMLGDYTTVPTFETCMGDPIAWGTPSICYYGTGIPSYCIPNQDPIISTWTFDNPEFVQIQFHLLGQEIPEDEQEFPDNFNPMDPSTYPETYYEPTNTSHFTLILTAKVDGQTSDSFLINLVMGPNPSGVETVGVDTDAPAVYYDLQGRQVANPAKGQLLIERRGTSARKVIL